MKKSFFPLFLGICYILVAPASVRAVNVISIDSYGAVANDSSVDATVRNSQAIALLKAAQGDAILVPRYSQYYIFSSVVSDVTDDIQLWIEGELIAHSNVTEWPYEGNNYLNILEIRNCKGLNQWALLGDKATSGGLRLRLKPCEGKWFAPYCLCIKKPLLCNS